MLNIEHGGWKSKSAMQRYFDSSVEFARRAAALRQAEEASRELGVDVSDVAMLDEV